MTTRSDPESALPPGIRAAGDAALLLAADPAGDEPGDRGEPDTAVDLGGRAGWGPAELAAAIAGLGLAGVRDVVPGARTVLVITEPGRWKLATLGARLEPLLQPDKAAPEPGRAPQAEVSAEAGLAAKTGTGTGTGAESGARADAGTGAGTGAGSADPVVIPVIYDGPDLAEVADWCGLSTDEVVARHQGAEYRVGWLGFSPGFGYLTGLDPGLARVPRRDRPRESVPAGSVAIAGGLSCVYPSASPGGWRLLGRTTARLWDTSADPPALLTPGARVRFRAADPDDAGAGRSQAGQSQAGQSQAGQSQAGRPRTGWSGARRSGAAKPGGVRTEAPGPGTSGQPPRAAAGHGVLEIVTPGPLATVQDAGRFGYAHLGVPPSGAADPDSLRLGNRLVGNPPDRAGLEFTLGRATLRCHNDLFIALTGALVPVTVAGHPVPMDEAVLVPAGSELRLGTAATGLRIYLSVRGGIAVPPVLGSRSADLLSGLGPPPLRPGDRLPVGPDPDYGRPASAPSPAPAPGDASAPVAGSPRGPVRSPGAGAVEEAVSPSASSWPREAGSPRGRDEEPVGLEVVAGPREDWFTEAARAALTRETYTVTPTSNRTGLRLAGPGLSRARDGELPSEGLVTGAIQVPPDGQPILLLTDHPATGGYPVIAVLATTSLGPAAQLRPGQRIRFRRAGESADSGPGDRFRADGGSGPTDGR